MKTMEKSAAADEIHIARLAYRNWRKDGCPAGRFVDYWLQAADQAAESNNLQVKTVIPSVLAEENRRRLTSRLVSNGTLRAPALPDLPPLSAGPNPGSAVS
jgi:hypothetical protein